jgi:hypothetical protein
VPLFFDGTSASNAARSLAPLANLLQPGHVLNLPRGMVTNRERQTQILRLPPPNGKTFGAPCAQNDTAGRRAGELLQFRVLGFRLLPDGKIGVGVFPGGKEVIVSRERPHTGRISICALRGSRFERIGAPLPDAPALPSSSSTRCRWCSDRRQEVAFLLHGNFHVLLAQGKIWTS